MIEPAGHRVLVESDKVEERTASGLYLPEQSREAEQNSTEVGTLLAIGPTAYRAYDGVAEWRLQVGDKVVFTRHGGKVVPSSKHEGVLRILNDIDIVGIYMEDD